jgi:predicted  nucleic acid-binding Zn-ribbon protein
MDLFLAPDASPLPGHIVIDANIELAAEQRDIVVAAGSRAQMHYVNMQKNAVEFCVALAETRQAHGERGWHEFASRNFPRLSLGNVRQCVRLGMQLVAMSEGTPEQRERLRLYCHLSQHALNMLIGAPEATHAKVTEELVAYEHTISDPASATAGEAARPPTAKEIAEWRDLETQAQRSREEAARLTAELGEARVRLDEATAMVSRRDQEREDLERKSREQSKLLAAAESSILTLREQLATRESRTPVESIVHRLPKGVQTEEEALAAIRQQVSEATTRRDRLADELNNTQEALRNTQRELHNAKQTADLLAELRTDITKLLSKYPAALVAFTEKKPEVRAARVEIAKGLRALADQLAPEAA